MPPAGNDFTAIAAGYVHSLALKSDGSIVGWGNNLYGQATPPAGNDFIAIAAGGDHGLALKSDGSIIGWGNNGSGQATSPAGNDFTAIAAGDSHGFAIKSDGTIVGWGYGEATPPAGNDFIAIAAGGDHGLALKSDGSIVGWGDNDYGEATPPADNNNFVAVAAGGYHSLALKSDGSIVGWGWNGDGRATPPAGNNFIAVAAGDGHSLALKTDGSIVGLGSNGYGQATPPAGNDFIAVAAGDYHSLALKSDGSIVGWGSNYYYNNYAGQATPPAGNNFIAVAAGGGHSLALKSDGSIIGWGSNTSWEGTWRGQATPPAGNNFIAIAAGGGHSLALKSDGSIIGWGNNGSGQATSPAGNDFTAIAAGGHHSLALKSDGSIVGWGYNGYGEATPPAGNNFIAIAAGDYHSLALKSDGSIVGWGSNYYYNTYYGQATPLAGNDFVAIAAGGYHSLALKSDGSIVGWGDNDYGEAGNDFITLAAGYVHSLALKGGQSFLTFKIIRVEPPHAGNTGPAALRVIGSGIKDGAIVRLTREGTELIPMESNFISSFRLDAKFDFNGVTPGEYNVIVTNPGGQSTQLAEGFEVIDGGSPHLWTRLTVPPQVRPGRSYTASIEYGNDGDVSMPIPILHISNSQDVSMQIGRNGRQSNIGLPLLGIGPVGFRTMLLPGYRSSIPIKFIAPNDDSVQFHLTAYIPDSNVFPWDVLESIVRPADMTDEEWIPEWARLVGNMGTTWEEVMNDLYPILTEIPDVDIEISADFIGATTFAMWFYDQPVDENLYEIGYSKSQSMDFYYSLLADTYGDFDPNTDVWVAPNEDFDPSRTCIYIITHGWNPDMSKMYALWERIKDYCPSSCNVLFVNWKKGADTVFPWGAAANIQPAGEKAYQKIEQIYALYEQSIDWNNVTFIGHSFGNNVNKVISGLAERKGRAIVLDPANSWGGAAADFSRFYPGGSMAVITDSWGDNGPCHPLPRRVADWQLHLHSSIFPSGHGEALRCFTEQIDSCANPWLTGTLVQSLPQSPPGWYDGEISCQGQIIRTAFTNCPQTAAAMTVPGTLACSASSAVIRPIDPSEKLGTIGYDPNDTPDELRRHFVHPGEPLMYTVFFENEPNATAPAQEVRVVDYLSPSLNWATIELGEVVFGDQVMTDLAGKVSGQFTVPLADSNYIVDVNAQFNVYTGQMSWVLRTIDPNTGELPEDPLAGFLPPNDANHCGEGHVSFSIYPQEGLLDAHIDNKATIFFDTEAPFDVNVWSNSVDGLPPVSAVSPLPALTIPTRFEVCWSGNDGQGCGIAGYDIYVAVNDEPKVPWILNTCETSAVFVGAPGHTYRFYSIAHDLMGNIESAPTVPDAETTMCPIDFHFYAMFADRWLENGCHSPLWCDGMDFDQNGNVGLTDLAEMASHWLEGM